MSSGALLCVPGHLDFGFFASGVGHPCQTHHQLHHWHSQRNTPTPVYCLGNPHSHDVCVFLSSYLLIFVIQPTFVPIFIQPLSVRPTSTPSLIHHYLIYDAIVIRLDHDCN